MPTRKTTTKTSKKSAARKKGPAKPAAAAFRSGAVPPYGVAIREAVARGNPREMKTLATAARQYLKNVQSALGALDKSLTTKR
ncbi:MAG TPA: DUF1843 domain-containing protein [Pyrinomonadaceae bacterium]|nr:DUF1843 domain-containing protein [Pyrinomonadaceae bacterium]